MATTSLQRLCTKITKLRIDHVVTRTAANYRPPRFRPPHWYVQKDRVVIDDKLTRENLQFIEEVKQDQLEYQNKNTPLLNGAAATIANWDPYSRRVGVIARKIGNYPLWLKDGKKVQTTLLQVVDNHVIKYIPPEEFNPLITQSKLPPNKRGCILVGSETVDPSSVTKEYCGLFNAVGMLPKRIIYRFTVTPNAALPTGTPLLATHYRVGDFIDVRAKTLDRGFQGVMKRWGFKGMPASHGVTKTHRRPGNIGAGGGKARVWPGTKMPGHMGNRWRTLRGVKILRINTQENVLWCLGVGIPGETGAYCYLYDTILPLRKLKSSPPFPTQPAVEDLPLEYYDESIHAFEEPSIAYEES